jgi:hypothetical protein
MGVLGVNHIAFRTSGRLRCDGTALVFCRAE